MRNTFGVAGEKVQCLYNFVDLSNARERMGEALDPQAQAFYEHHKKIMVHAGRLISLKAQSRLIRVLARMRKEGKDVGLVILGEGEERQKLTECAKEYGVTEHVYMPGEIKNPFAYFKRSHAFVLCSEYEGLPMVLIEALACGCPVVSVDMVSGAREILAPDTEVGKKASAIEYAKYGILTPQYAADVADDKNEQLLTQAVTEMIYEERIRSRYLQSCAEGAERFSKDQILEQWRELIEE
jgi:glycosyltransferase involved in cell wall biosynthesis